MTPLPDTPALVIGHVRHVRRSPLEHAFRHRIYQWLVDVDDLPRPSGWRALVCRFDARDHLDAGRLGGGIRGDVERFCAARGVSLAPDDRVLMLAHAREAGWVFDPLTVFWCLSPDGVVRAVVMEVHNTYGERHAYLLSDVQGGDEGDMRADVAKEFYVSPFHDLEGSYRVGLLLDLARVVVSVQLRRPGAASFDAVVDGTVVPATAAGIRRALCWAPGMNLRVWALIRAHGIWLWLRRLPVQPRPTHGRAGVR